jgi:hypothetical protein
MSIPGSIAEALNKEGLPAEFPAAPLFHLAAVRRQAPAISALDSAYYFQFMRSDFLAAIFLPFFSFFAIRFTFLR